MIACRPRVIRRVMNLLPIVGSGANQGIMSKRASRKFFYVLQDRKRLPQRFFAALSGRATAHL